MRTRLQGGNINNSHSISWSNGVSRCLLHHHGGFYDVLLASYLLKLELVQLRQLLKFFNIPQYLGVFLQLGNLHVHEKFFQWARILLAFCFLAGSCRAGSFRSLLILRNTFCSGCMLGWTTSKKMTLARLLARFTCAHCFHETLLAIWCFQFLHHDALTFMQPQSLF